MVEIQIFEENYLDEVLLGALLAQLFGDGNYTVTVSERTYPYSRGKGKKMLIIFQDMGEHLRVVAPRKLTEVLHRLSRIIHIW